MFDLDINRFKFVQYIIEISKCLWSLNEITMRWVIFFICYQIEFKNTIHHNGFSFKIDNYISFVQLNLETLKLEV